MKISTSFACIALLIISLRPTAEALVESSWSMTNAPSTGLTDITFPITIVEADHISGYYFAQMYGFGNSRRAYIGIQPRPDDKNGKPVLHATFSNFVKGSTPADANCHQGADGGDGVSCSVEWNGVYGRTYDFEVMSDRNQHWVGTVVDTVTKQRTLIGNYTMPAGTGGIESYEVGFVEWYPWNGDIPPNHCAHLPYQKTIFGIPRTTHASSVGTQSLMWEYGDCVGQVAFHTDKVASGAENNCGFKGQIGLVVNTD